MNAGVINEVNYSTRENYLKIPSPCNSLKARTILSEVLNFTAYRKRLT